MAKNILVTGATGYLGSQIVISLVKKGFNVIILKRKSSSLRRFKLVAENIKMYDIENINLSHIIEVNHIDTIIHTATAYGRNGETL